MKNHATKPWAGKQSGCAGSKPKGRDAVVCGPCRLDSRGISGVQERTCVHKRLNAILEFGRSRSVDFISRSLSVQDRGVTGRGGTQTSNQPDESRWRSISNEEKSRYVLANTDISRDAAGSVDRRARGRYRPRSRRHYSLAHGRLW